MCSSLRFPKYNLVGWSSPSKKVNKKGLHSSNTMTSPIILSVLVFKQALQGCGDIGGCVVNGVVSSCAAETESEKSIGLELKLDDDTIFGQDFFVRAEVTNKTDTIR